MQEESNTSSAVTLPVISNSELIGAFWELKTLPSATRAGRVGTILKCREMQNVASYTNVMNAVKTGKKNISLTPISSHLSVQHVRRASHLSVSVTVRILHWTLLAQRLHCFLRQSMRKQWSLPRVANFWLPKLKKNLLCLQKWPSFLPRTQLRAAISRLLCLAKGMWWR